MISRIGTGSFEGRPDPLRLQDLPADISCEIFTLARLGEFCSDNQEGYCADQIAEVSGREVGLERRYLNLLCQRGDAAAVVDGAYRITAQGSAFLDSDSRGGSPRFALVA